MPQGWGKPPLNVLSSQAWRKLLQPENQRAAIAARDQPRGVLQWHFAASPQTHKPELSCLLQCHPCPPSSPCLCRIVYNLDIHLIPKLSRLWLGNETCVTVSAHQRPHSHSICRDGKGKKQNRGDGRDWFCVGGAPHWDFCQSVFKDLGGCSSSELPLSLLSTNPVPPTLLPPLQPFSVSKVSVRDWYQTEICWWKVVVFAFLFFPLKSALSTATWIFR